MNTISNQQQRRPKRPIDKQLFSVVQPNQGTTLLTRQVRTSVVSETFTSMKLTFAMSGGVDTGDKLVALCVVRTRDGAALGTISFSNGGQIYSIDNDLLYGRFFMLPTGADVVSWINEEISINAQRKLKVGDGIAILLDGNANNQGFISIHSASFFKQ